MSDTIDPLDQLRKWSQLTPDGESYVPVDVRDDLKKAVVEIEGLRMRDRKIPAPRKAIARAHTAWELGEPEWADQVFAIIEAETDEDAEQLVDDGALRIRDENDGVIGFGMKASPD